MRSATRSSRGVTILEIMMAFALIAMVIVAFAAVFPAGYRLNFANLQENKAASLANSVAEELRIIPVNPSNSPGTLAYFAAQKLKPSDLVKQHYIKTDVVAGKPQPDGRFYLEDDPVSSTTSGVVINVVDSTTALRNPVPAPAVSTATIQVTVQWEETRRSTVITKSVSVTTMTTDAMER